MIKRFMIIMRALAVIFVFLFSCTSVQEKPYQFYDDSISFVDVNKLIKKSKTYPVRKDDDVLVLLDKVLYYLPSTKQDKIILQVHQVTKALTKKSNVNTFITYVEGYEKINRIEAFTIDEYGDKSIASQIISKKPFDNELINIPLYKDIKVLLLSFDDVGKNATIHIRYEMEIAYRGIEGGNFYMGSYRPTMKKKYVFILPKKDKKLFFKGINTKFKPRIIPGNLYNHYVFENDKTIVFEKEEYAAALSELSPRIMFSFFKGWLSFSYKLSLLFTPYSHTPLINKLVYDKAPSDVDNKTSKSKAILSLYNFVTDIDKIKNVIVPFGIGRIKPFNPDKTLKASYADSKDKAFLLHSMLKARGIKSYLAFTSEEEGLDKDIVSIKHIDRILVAVQKKDASFIYMDPSSVLLRYNSLPSKLYGKDVFILGFRDKDSFVKGSFRTIPNVSEEDNKIVYKTKSFVSDRGVLYKTVFSPKGDYETKERLNMIKVKFKNRFDSVEQNYKAIYEKDNLKVLGLEYNDPFDLEQPFSYTTEFLLPRNKADRFIDFNPTVYDKTFFSSFNTKDATKKRLYDFHYPLIFSVVSENIISYSKNYSAAKLPKSISYENDFFLYKASFKRIKGYKILCKRYFVLKKRIIKQKDYALFRKLIDELITLDSRTIRFKRR